jgi:DNA-binding MarR family transcriptional regulator
MGILASAESATYTYLREHLELSESDLSKQMSTLEAAGYVKATKSGRGPGSQTSYWITRAGTTAFRAHRAALIALVSGTSIDSTPVQ